MNDLLYLSNAVKASYNGLIAAMGISLMYRNVQYVGLTSVFTRRNFLRDGGGRVC